MIPPITCTYKDLPYKERPFLPINECQLYATMRTPNLSQTKISINYPNSDTLEL